MVTRLEALIPWLALPVYIWQGLGVRRRSVRLEPPKGPAVTELKGKGKLLRVLVLGDSSAAGVGVSDFRECFSGRLPFLLSEKSGRPITVRVSGNNSATSGQIRDFVVPNLEPAPYDYISLNIGTNDAKNFHSGRRFCKEFGSLLYALHARFPDTTIIWSGVIDLEKVPALPHPLNRILGIRSRVITKNGRILCAERNALAPISKWEVIPENFSQDGFHAGSVGYQKWAEELADYILELEADRIAAPSFG